MPDFRIIIIILSYYFVCIIFPSAYSRWNFFFFFFFLIVLGNISKNNFTFLNRVEKPLSFFFHRRVKNFYSNRIRRGNNHNEPSARPIFVLLLLYCRIISYVLFFLPPTLNAISSFFYFSRSFRKCFNFQK